MIHTSDANSSDHPSADPYAMRPHSVPLELMDGHDACIQCLSIAY